MGNTKTVTVGRFYFIKSLNSHKFLDVRTSSMNDKAQVIQYHLTAGDNQKFFLFPSVHGGLHIAAKHSGKFLDVEGGSTHNKAEIIQYYFTGGKNQSFDLEGKGGFIFAVHSGKVLDIRGKSKDDGAIVQQYDKHGGANQKFELVEAWSPSDESVKDEIKAEKGIPEVEPYQIDFDDKYRIKDFGKQPIAMETEYKLVGEKFLPFYCVNESRSRDRQVKQTPFYRFARKQFWRNVVFKEHDGKSKETIEYEVKEGATEKVVETLEGRLNISLKWDSGFSYKGLTASFSRGIELELKVSTTKETQRMVEKRTKHTIEYPAERAVYSYWQMIDLYTLSTLSGSEIDRWEVEIPTDNRFIEDAYPPETLQKLKHTTVRLSAG